MSFTFDFNIESSIDVIVLKGDILTNEKDDDIIQGIKVKMDSGQQNFIMNLKEIEYINSSGLNLMLKTFTYVRNRGGDMFFSEANKLVSDLLNISKLNTVFNITADNNSAIQQLKELNNE